MELVFAAHSSCESSRINRCRVRDGAWFEDSGRLGMDGTHTCAWGEDASIRASLLRGSVAVSGFASNDAACVLFVYPALAPLDPDFERIVAQMRFTASFCAGVGYTLGALVARYGF
jgi:hypothetical protein